MIPSSLVLYFWMSRWRISCITPRLEYRYWSGVTNDDYGRTALRRRAIAVKKEHLSGDRRSRRWPTIRQRNLRKVQLRNEKDLRCNPLRWR